MCDRLIHLFISLIVQCTDGQINLFGTSHTRIGILRVCVNGSWSRVCANNGDTDNHIATTVCSELGYSPYGK